MIFFVPMERKSELMVIFLETKQNWRDFYFVGRKELEETL